jgi:phospholipid transport system substrate-binding protein
LARALPFREDEAGNQRRTDGANVLDRREPRRGETPVMTVFAVFATWLTLSVVFSLGFGLFVRGAGLRGHATHPVAAPSPRRFDRPARRRGPRMTVARCVVLLALLGVMPFITAPPASAETPRDELRAAIDRVIKTVDDAELRKDGRARERRAAIRKIVGEIFDVNEAAMRSLGRHWQARTPAEREEFAHLFGDLLERSYVSKIELYRGERITYAGETIDGDQAAVRTRIVTKQGTEIPVDYRMFKRGSRWRVYDVVIEGVSLIGNYRTQFNTIILSSSFEALVKKIKAKRDESA